MTPTNTATFGALGGEIIVNDQGLGNQTQPDVARIDSGEFVVVWHTSYAGDYIEGQRFDASGARVGSSIRVSSGAASEAGPGQPAVAMDPSGSFVVVWPAGDASTQNVFGQGFASDGTKSGGVFTVGAVADNNTIADVFSRGSGEFTVVRSFNGPPMIGASDINGYMIDGTGMPLAASFPVATAQTSLRSLAAARAPNGRFVVAWGAYTVGGYDVSARTFAPDGMPASAAFPVNEISAGNHGMQGIGAAANAGNDFLIVWAGDNSDGDGLGVAGRLFDGSGTALNSEFVVNEVVADQQGQYSGARIAYDSSSDEFLATWASLGQPGSDQHEVFARRLNSKGDPVSGEFQVNTFVTGSQGAEPTTTGGISVAADNTGEFVVTWSSEGQLGMQREIVARRFGVD